MKNAASRYELAKRSPVVLIGIILLLMSLIFLRLSVEERRYETRGQKVQGTVLSKQAGGGSGSHKLYVRYRFTTPGAQTIEGRGEVFRRTWATLREGGPVEVQYLPDSPDTNRIPGKSASASTYRGISGGLLLASSVVLGIGLRRAYAHFRLLHHKSKMGGSGSIE